MLCFYYDLYIISIFKSIFSYSSKRCSGYSLSIQIQETIPSHGFAKIFDGSVKLPLILVSILFSYLFLIKRVWLSSFYVSDCGLTFQLSPLFSREHHNAVEIGLGPKECGWPLLYYLTPLKKKSKAIVFHSQGLKIWFSSLQIVLTFLKHGISESLLLSKHDPKVWRRL